MRTLRFQRHPALQRRSSSLLVVAVVLGASIGPIERVSCQEWTRYRGPNGAGTSDASGIPTRWSDEDVNWKAKLPGIGHSQPVVWGDKVFLTSAEDGGAKRTVLCVGTKEGKTLWTRGFESEKQDRHQRNSHASSTPAVDEERVYVVVSSPSSHLLLALDHGGKEIWKRDLGPSTSKHGDGTSPIVVGDLVVLAKEEDGPSFVAAMDKKSGEIRWKTPRDTAETAYGTPIVFEEGGRTALLLSSHAHGLNAIEASSGKPLWEAKVFDKRTVSSPLFTGGLALGTCGSGGGGSFLVAVRPGGKGDVAGTHVAYKLTRRIPYVPTPVAKGDLLFLWADMGVVSCVEIPTGKLLWEDRADGNYSGSPVCIGDRVYCLSEEGEAVVIAAAREFKLLARNPLGEGSRSTPAVAGGRLYVRTYSHLISIGGKKPAIE